jgi:predicted amidohydrolase
MVSIRKRPVRVATVSHRPSIGVDSPETSDRFLAATEPLLQRASRMGADLVVFPELYPQLALADPFHHPEPATSGTLTGIQDLAKRFNLNIVWPRLEYEVDRGIRNTAHLVGRDGQLIGRYDKMFPTESELAKGVVPGNEVCVFDTDFGRVGLLICFDLNFTEVRDGLKRAAPDVVTFSSMYRGGLQAQALAYELRAFVITSISAELGQILDRCGRVLKESTYEALAVAPINTNSVALHMDRNWNKMDAMLSKYGSSLTFDYHTREAFYVIEAGAEHPISDIVREFDLESADAYLDRSRRLRNDAAARFASTANRGVTP